MKLLHYTLGFIIIATLGSCATPPSNDYTNSASQPGLQPLAVPASVGTNNANSNAGSLSASNPAHGMPGHRCDIAVGAPLNSAIQMPAPQLQPVTNAQAPAAAPMFASPAPVSSAPVPASPLPTTPLKTAAGLNPAHGMPGHRCDIAVGASLSSPVQGNTQQPSTAASPQFEKTPVTKPATASASPKNSAGLNPAHGLAGHRCDIPVGASLSLPLMTPAAPKP